MKLQQYSKSGLVTIFLVAISARAGVAFSIIPQQPGAIDNYEESAFYVLPDLTSGEVWLDTYLPTYPETGRDISGGVTEIERGGTEGFLNLLQPFVNEGWNFTSAPSDLEGNFGIINYYACAPLTFCGIEDFPADYDRGGVGSHFHLKYRPGNNDPYGNGVRWIQRVIASYENEQGQYDFIDIGKNQNNPFYDYDSEAGSDYFIDTPYSPAPKINH